MFELKDVYASYGEGMVLRHVSLEAPKGRVTCLVGRNGAGKTTTLKSVMGLVKTPQGKILLDDKEIQDLPVYERAKKGIGYVPQGREIFPQLTVEENILLGLEAKKGKGGIPDFIYETFPILNEFRKRKGGDLSGGQQQQLAIARAVAAEPALLILDEPTEGIQPSVIQEIGRVITELKSRMAVLIVEQYLEFVMEIADYYGWGAGGTGPGKTAGHYVVVGGKKSLPRLSLSIFFAAGEPACAAPDFSRTDRTRSLCTAGGRQEKGLFLTILSLFSSVSAAELLPLVVKQRR